MKNDFSTVAGMTGKTTVLCFGSGNEGDSLAWDVCGYLRGKIKDGCYRLDFKHILRKYIIESYRLLGENLQTR